MGLLSLAGHRARADDTVTVSEGKILGSTQGAVRSYRGIPFAAPPVGNMRWRPPAPPAPWTAVQDASRFGPQCIQIDFAGKHVANQSEDCLTLNVWAPADAKPGDKRPVMVWIYGGAWILGGGSVEAYDGTNFARRGVILITFNYRLGKLGFFAHPALSAEDPSAPLANFGVLDTIAALTWVKTNIGSFGGDADNVTIFGQSAGGMMVNQLMTSRAADGLFQKAISMSGAFSVPLVPLRDGEHSAEAQGLAFAAAHGIRGTGPDAAAALRALPADVIAGHSQIALPAGTDRVTPIADGMILTEAAETAFLNRREAKVPYIAGNTSWEASLNPTIRPDAVFARLGAEEAAIKTAYLRSAGDEARAAKDAMTDSMLTAPVRTLTGMHAANGQKAYAYYFSYLPREQRGRGHGVPHGGDLLYAFDNLPTKPYQFYDLSHPAAEPRDRHIADTMIGFLINFARSGSPAQSHGVTWPEIGADYTVMEFGPDNVQPRPRFRKTLLDAVSRVSPISPIAPPDPAEH